MSDDPWELEPDPLPTFDEIIEMFEGPCSAHLEICELIPECSVCNVRDGNPCVNATGTVTKIPHVKRITAARKAGW